MAGTLVIFEILLLAFVKYADSITSVYRYHSHNRVCRAMWLKRQCACIQPGPATERFPRVSLKANSLLCHSVTGLQQYFQVCDKLLPLPEEIDQEFSFLLSGGKSTKIKVSTQCFGFYLKKVFQHSQAGDPLKLH